MRNRSWPLVFLCGLIWTAVPGALISAQVELSQEVLPEDELPQAASEIGQPPSDQVPSDRLPSDQFPSDQFPRETGTVPAMTPSEEENPSSVDWPMPASESEMWAPEPFRPVVYFSTEYLLTWGKGPGDNLIGAGQYRNVPFFAGFPKPFPQQSTGAFDDQFHQGVLGRLGWDNEDGSGFQFSGFNVFARQQSQGPGRVFHGTDYGNLQTLASIPLDDGAGGTIVSPQAPFDSAFVQTYNQRIFGGDIDAYFTPFLARPSTRLRFLWGAKYLNIRENFSVVAGESGLDYVVDLNTGAIVPGTVKDIGLSPNELQIRSQTTSQLIGPQVGVRYDLVTSWLNIWGQSRLAVAANLERLQIAGQGVTNTFQLAPPPAGVPFQQSSSSCHVSPVFDTSLYMDLPLLAALPVINQLALFNQAKFRIGYNFLVVGEIARPANIIVYNAPVPQLQSDRTTFFLNTLSLGVNWTY